MGLVHTGTTIKRYFQNEWCGKTFSSRQDTKAD